MLQDGQQREARKAASVVGRPQAGDQLKSETSWHTSVRDTHDTYPRGCRTQDSLTHVPRAR
jgi:hypothetical protein